MATLKRGLAAALTLAMATVLVPGQGRAQRPPSGWTAAATSDAQATPRRTSGKAAGDREARAHFQKAEKAFNLGRFADALTEYEAAYQIRPLPALLFNIAQCHRNLGDSERAVFFYRRYLALEPASEDRELVQELISEQQRLAREKERATAGPPPPAAPVAGADPAAVAVSPPPERGEPPPLYKRWWVWTAAGVVAAGVTAALLIPRDGPLPTGRLESVDRR